jgi:uncharacterized protein YndB with AHSA1/START domain
MNTDSTQRRLRLERIVRAPPAHVFGAFVDPQSLSEWWGPIGFTVPRVDLDARAGGRYRIEMQPPEGDRFLLYGEYREVERPGRLAYTFTWDPATADDQENLVALTFQPVNGGTRLILDHGPFRTDERYKLHEAGWTDTLDRLETWLAANAA